MVQYILKRLGISLAIIYIVLTVSFFMVRLMPGNPMAALEAQLRVQGGMTEQEIEQRVQTVYGLMPKAPLGTQYLDYLGNILHGNLGRPITNPSTTVVAVIGSALPWTILVVAVSLLISFVIGVYIGNRMAVHPGSTFAKVWTFIVSVMGAVPSYLVAIVLLYFLTGIWRVFPSNGAYDVGVTPGFNWPFISSVAYHAVLPIAASVITSFGGWALAMKGSAVSVLGSEYVRAAEARGLSDRVISRSYIGRNSMLPMITQLALAVGFMFGGSVFVETYFQYPGIGYYMVQSVNSRDYSLMMGCFVLITTAVVVANFLVDLLYPAVDPRIAWPSSRKVAATGGEPTTETVALVAQGGV
ncbi:MAG: ABC transporter permease [Microbacteriaceae bacterium]|nr:ABC transporter permease [Microbacteriaceae bacterium]MCL2793857.1 ABC transporter permease [Microbacteriaceae bacterium]